MTQPLYIYQNFTYDPYENLATEQYLLDSLPDSGCILYLWQNQNTVVIGQNQNPWAECRTTLLQQENGKLARRLSGGGAVFHDLGNLNFTFIMEEADFNLEKQLLVIQEACLQAGIRTEFSGRNDILTGGQKFSGNAFYHSQGKAYHHGTLLVDADMDKLSRYLCPPKAKLESKGVRSVRSRVVNLKTLNPELTCDTMRVYMRQAFEKVYGGSAETITISKDGAATIDKLRQSLSQWDYLYGKPLPFSFACEGHFSWGNIHLQLCANEGIITQVKAYSDSMDWAISSKIENALTGCRFRLDAMTAALRSSLLPEIFHDLSGLLHEQNI